MYCTLVLLRDMHRFIFILCAGSRAGRVKVPTGLAAVPAPLPLGGAVGGHGVYVPVQLMGGGQTLA